jgi:hypothetical protein
MKAFFVASRWPRRWISLLILVVPLGFPVSAYAQSCKVVDPELQTRYSGTCKDGLAEGVGEAGGVAVYRGTFRAGMKNGYGIKIWPWGDRYQGEFANDVFDGYGHYIWNSSGSSMSEEYRGQFRAGRRDGVGEYHWSTGDRLSGTWQADMPSSPADPRLFERLMARSRMTVESQIAVGKVGAKVCRRANMGLSESEWIKGMVVAVLNSSIAVEIEIAGIYPKILNGVELRRGAMVWDKPPHWSLCH